MNHPLPPPATVAAGLIDRAHRGHTQYIDGPVERVMADAPWADRDALFSGLTAFHKERMERIPSPAKYPEAKPYVEHRLAVERALCEAGLSDWERAILGGMNDYLTFRGYRLAAQSRRKGAGGSAKPNVTEKCRVAYDPETDEGQLCAVNLDDPATFWKKPRTKPDLSDPMWGELWKPLSFAGVGSGLHLDVEPDELFPLPVTEMCRTLCTDVPAAAEFLTRYGRFWSGGNLVIRDRQKRSVAIEKCSRTFTEVFQPAVRGRSHISGMACRNPDSPQGRHQQAMRREYLELSGRPWDAEATVDVAFWNACDLAEQMLARFLSNPGQIKAADLLALLATPFPKGLCKNGWRFHPQQGYTEYTLITYAAFLDNRRIVRYQREDPPDLSWPASPEVCTV